MLAVYGKTPEVRRRATETLRGRSAEDFLYLLVGLMIDPYKYEVKPVAGPGSPGVLFVEGEKFNVSRFYAPPPAPNITLQPGDTISYDQTACRSSHVPWESSRSTPQGVPGSKTLVERNGHRGIRADLAIPAHGGGPERRGHGGSPARERTWR